VGSDFDPVTALLEGDHRVLLPDRPGYGRSDGPAVGMAAGAELMADLLEERGAVPATVVGHSYGGGIAVLLAARRPELVSGLVLVASVGRAASLGVVDHALAAPWAGEALAATGLVALGRLLPHVRGLAGRLPGQGSTWLEASLPDRRYSAVASGLGRRIWRTFVAEQRALIREIGDVEAALAQVRAPTVVITGLWDIVVPPAVAVSMAAAIGGAELVTVARLGHFVPRDAPGVVADAIRQLEGGPGA
jgi:pimeloyl-ACP methyl ester carboxylesterase